MRLIMNQKKVLVKIPPMDVLRCEEQRVISRNNSFDLIRHLAALAVLVSHHYVLSGFQEPMLKGYSSLGAIAVLAFFAISGFLISQSFLTTASFYAYMEKRVARILPALIACAFLMVYVAGIIFSKNSGVGYVFSLESVIDFFKVIVFGRVDVNDITSGFIFKDSFNGSLWTLKIEFGFYVALALALMAMRSAVMPIIIALLFCITAYICTVSMHPMAPKFLVYSTVGIAFFLGSSFYFYRALFDRPKVKLSMALASVVLIVTSLNTPFVMVLASVGISVLVLMVGTLFNEKIIRSRFDISYGMYLYAFPVQQLMINLSSLGFYASLLTSIAVVVFLSTLSWFSVEKPVLSYVHGKSGRRLSVASVQ
ncbi:Acyltransferase 3 [Pseudomonas syringae pv. delphinii]|uniref:Acyltransferase 3 n=2 Tax=Pseudomonas syringae group genomosp. 3 TaxID=251701 RepID=A0A0P9UB08_9PSED|nr:Acyltransferase 3 [Pseudomonas syringae pv. delphinii]RMP08719.1 Acyltransferase 3 [Pseudomonas syringae pv. delphinii]RMP28201.1 Acyltransferase 3 [Pseudomonas syringae pv. delphinii]RMQ22960.1 Acyltransferase 3 [Pseudomonas syringae pv. delphinii]